MFNVVDYGAVGNGSTDDTTAIRAAIAAAKAAKGGQCYFPPGVYKITDTLTIDSPVGFVGAGNNTYSVTNGGTYNNVTSLIAYYGAPSKPMVNYTGRIEGVLWENIAMDCRNLANVAMKLDRVRQSLFRQVTLLNPTFLGLWMIPNPEAGVKDDNCMFNHFQNLAIRCSAANGASCMRLDGTVIDKNNPNAGGGNTCHNTFTNTFLWVNNNWNVEFNDCDNNSFYMLYCFKVVQTSYQIYFGYNINAYNPRFRGTGCARSNYIYHCQGSIFASAGPTRTAPECRNFVYGYDRENGQPMPIVANNARVVII